MPYNQIDILILKIYLLQQILMNYFQKHLKRMKRKGKEFAVNSLHKKMFYNKSDCQPFFQKLANLFGKVMPA
ncbi:hypothetical protein E5983_09050 [Streptococcus danieliae]|uniref:Transposase n=1 Tax=Streptococcus danieliae TaxID=747656 RepID=A0A7X3GBH6_9STRE|nr:hypothetical protein [Streptococcus danieliae]MVX59764.1 hypothetical protein [Streptococcus danieliae]